MKKILLTGGGTAGHITPHFALYPYLKKHFSQIYYIGGKNSLEEKMVTRLEGVKFFSITTTKLHRKLTLKNLLIPLNFAGQLAKAKNS
jgi:UDP-N-acetylglucosamine--N-acetylmuramyl-(pentapeptide) pyrophosphoryl-undecaprenol N-acetylglucosamine transferase